MNHSAPTKFLFLTLALTLIAAIPPHVLGDDNNGLWNAHTVVGTPQFSPNGSEWFPIGDGQSLPPGSTVATGSHDRLLLQRQQHFIMLYADSRLTLRSDDDQSISIFQRLGEALYRIKHGLHTNFEVETPFMLAGVKGTTFGVQVDSDSAATFLLEGQVLLSNPHSNSATTLMPGDMGRALTGATSIESGPLDHEEFDRWSERVRTMVDHSPIHSSTQPRNQNEGLVHDSLLGAPLLASDPRRSDAALNPGNPAFDAETEVRANDPALHIAIDPPSTVPINILNTSNETLIHNEMVPIHRVLDPNTTQPAQ